MQNKIFYLQSWGVKNYTLDSFAFNNPRILSESTYFDSVQKRTIFKSKNHTSESRYHL